jgi:dipeptidyl aminopeptidase/acylaminoacyl peptidase
MRTILAASAIFILMSTLVSAQTLSAPPAVTDPKLLKSRTVTDLQQFSIEKLYMTRQVGSTGWSPDGRQVVFVSNISGRNNLWTIPAGGGWPVQLTISDQRQTSPAWSPDGKWIAYMSDYDGDEQWDIFLVSPAGGEVVNLTLSRETAEEDPAWSPDGAKLAFSTKPKVAPNAEIDVVDVVSRKTVHITKDTPRELSNSNPVWSHDGKWLAFTQSRADGKDSNIFLAEIATGKLTNLTPHEGEHNHYLSDFAPDGQKLLITSDAANDYENVGLLDIATKNIEWLTRDKWEISAHGFSPDGKQAVWTANVDGVVGIYFYDLATKKAEQLPIKPGVNAAGGSESAFTRDGSKFLYYHNGADSPNDAWVYDVKTRQSTQLTNSLVAGLRTADMVEPTLVHFPSKDGKHNISAWAYVPNNVLRNAKYPAIVYIHGGPTAQSMNGFNRIVQYMLNQGYLVIAPNYRGSTGYGKDFTEANRMDAGGGELQDVADAADFITRSGFVDPKKLIVMGGSYGGYLSMMAVTKFPEMWAAGVPIVPFVNWFTEFENEDPLLQEFDRKFMGDPVKNKDLWHDRSPIFFVERIKAPLLLLAGGNDPRCPKSEAQQVADQVKKHGGIAQLKIYENEGHGFARVENQIDAYKRVSDFLKTHVPSPGCGCSVVE